MFHGASVVLPLTIITLLQVVSVQCAGSKIRLKPRIKISLTEHLFRQYDSLTSPSNLSVTFSLAFVCVQYDPLKRLLTTTSLERYVWNDDRLKWKPADYDNVTQTRVPAYSIWKPDIILYNSHEWYEKKSVDDLNVIIGNSGRVMWLTPVVYRSLCSTKTTGPINCNLRFRSWTYDANVMKLKSKELNLDEGGEDVGNVDMFVRSSKYRHIFGCPAKKDQCYEGVRVTKNAHDASYCAVNPKFVAIVIESGGGGVFVALPLEKTGRVEPTVPKVCGHRGPITDIRWNPFDDNSIASCSEDSMIKIWHIPDGGLTEDLVDSEVDLSGHAKKVSYIEWHPTAAHILLSAGLDFQCIVWNVKTSTAVKEISVHHETIFSMSWNRDGSLFATTSKDRIIRVIDPRTGNVICQCEGHHGNKTSKVVFLGDKLKLFSTGFSKTSEREFAIWDIKYTNDISSATLSCLKTEIIDSSNGVLLPFYDHDTGVVYLAGKGDGNVRYFEIVETAPYVHYLSQYQSNLPQRGLGVMPKRGVDVRRCEVARFYKLHTAKDLCEPIAMIVPRKSEMFQSDIFPPTSSIRPSLSADDWLNGQNREPVLVSLKDGKLSNVPEGSISLIISDVKPKNSSTNQRQPQQHQLSNQQLSNQQRSNIIQRTSMDETVASHQRIDVHSKLKSYSRSTEESSVDLSPLSTPNTPQNADPGLVPGRLPLRRARQWTGRGEDEDDQSSSCSSTEDQSVGRSSWNENPLYSQGKSPPGRRKTQHHTSRTTTAQNNQSAQTNKGSVVRGRAAWSKVDTGPLDDVLNNVQATSTYTNNNKQISYSSHDLTRSELPASMTITTTTTTTDSRGEIRTRRTRDKNSLSSSSGLLTEQSRFKSEPDIQRPRLDPIRHDVSIYDNVSSTNQRESSGGEGEDREEEGSGESGGRGTMIDCISVDAPDDVLIKPSNLRESMRSKRRRERSVDRPYGKEDSEGGGVKIGGSLRRDVLSSTGSDAGGLSGGVAHPADAPPRFVRGLYRTGSLRESGGHGGGARIDDSGRGLVQHKTDLANPTLTRNNVTRNNGTDLLQRNTEPLLSSQQPVVMTSQHQFTKVIPSLATSSVLPNKPNSPKYTFSVDLSKKVSTVGGPMNSEDMIGAGSTATNKMNCNGVQQSSSDNLHHDYKELLSRYFRQQEEMKRLQAQLLTKDSHIRRLEEQLKQSKIS